MISVKQGARVVDKRQPDIIGTARMNSDPLNGLVRVDWDCGGLSLLHVSVLNDAPKPLCTT